MQPFILIILTATTLVTSKNLSIFPSLPITALNTNNSLCNTQSETYIQNLENFTLWASEMWDATAKATTGVLRGNIFQMGHFEQCLTAKAPFLTKYCLVNLKANILEVKRRDPLSLYHDPGEHILKRIHPQKDASQQVRNVVQVGWCVPASCSGEDLEDFLDVYLNGLDLVLMKDNVSYSASVPEITCTTNKDDSKFNTADICFCSLSMILVILVIVGTVSETIKNDPNKATFLSRFLTPFSARKNFTDLTKKDESNSALGIFYGLRTLSILCIIMGHRFGTFISAALMNFNYVEKEYRGLVGSFITHEDFFVDVFFIMSGLLVTYGVLNQLDKKKVNPGFIVMMRYIRLTPVYAFVIFYYATIFNYSGMGPLWKVVAGQDSQDCKDNWWTNLLYISNYVNADHMCMTHSWYLPCDFHYFIVAVALCFLIKKKKNIGLFTLLFLTIISIIIPFTLTFIYRRPAVLRFYPDFLTSPKTHPDFLLTYIKSHTRATVYFLGMFVGYIYHRIQKKSVHLSRSKSYVVFLVSLLFMIIPFVTGVVFYDPYHKYNPLESAIYASLSRPSFAIGMIGIIYVCGYGNGGFIRGLLNWAPWVPLSKLVYSAYLVHMQFQLRSAASFKNPQYFSYFDVISLSLSDIMLSFLTACVLYLVVEAPFREFFKEVLTPKKNIHERRISRTEKEDVRNGNFESRL